MLYVLFGLIALLSVGCVSKQPPIAIKPVAAPMAVASTASQPISATDAADRYDAWRQELERYKQAERERWRRLEALRVATYLEIPTEEPVEVMPSGPDGSNSSSAAVKMDAWVRHNAEMKLGSQLQKVRLYELRRLREHGISPRWLEERVNQ